jgi:SSS family transporter
MLIKLVVSGAYLGVLFFFALAARRRTRNLEDYYVGGRNVRTPFVVLSFSATFVSTNSFVGHSAKSYVFGMSWLLVGAVLVLLTALSWAFIAPRFRERAAALGSIVPSDLFRLHFRSQPAGVIAACIILFDSIFFLAAVFLGAAESLSALMGFRFGIALMVVLGVQLIYTTFGGYLAVVWSDSVQAVILLLGAVALPVGLIMGVGGWDAMWNTLETADAARLSSKDTFSLLRITTHAPLIFILGIGFSGGLKMVADPRQLSRFYGLRKNTSARGGLVWITLLVAVAYVLLLPIGLLAHAYNVPPEVAQRTDAIVPWLLGQALVIGPLLGSVILTALVAAAMSTIDSVLLVAAAAAQKDLLPLAGLTSKNELRLARGLVFACAVVALVCAALARRYPALDFGIVELTVLAGAIYAAAFLPGLLGILYWSRSSVTGVIGGMLTGVATTVAWRFYFVPVFDVFAKVPEVFVGVLAGAAAFVSLSLARPTPSAYRADRA